jgi:hypothetical protein
MLLGLSILLLHPGQDFGRKLGKNSEGFVVTIKHLLRVDFLSLPFSRSARGLNGYASRTPASDSSAGARSKAPPTSPLPSLTR